MSYFLADKTIKLKFLSLLDSVLQTYYAMKYLADVVMLKYFIFLQDICIVSIIMHIP